MEAIESLQRRWKGREGEILELGLQLGGEWDYSPPIHVFGQGGTGKTSVVRDLFRQLGRPYAYISCVQLHTISTIVHSIIYQLPASKENEIDIKRKSRLKAFDLAIHLEKVAPIMGRTHYIIIDDCQRLYDDNEKFFFTLLRMPEQHSVNVVFLLISPVPWAYFRTSTYPQPPPGIVSVHFTQYETTALVDILLLDCPPAAHIDVYKVFLKTVINMCVRAACRLQELRTVAEKLWPLIATHLGTTNHEQPPVTQVHGILMKHQKELSELVEHMGWPSHSSAGRSNKSIAQLPLIGQIVLVASYLASKIASNSRVRKASLLRDVGNTNLEGDGHELPATNDEEMEAGLPAQQSRRTKKGKSGDDQFRKRRKGRGRTAQASNFKEDDVGGTRGGVVIEKASLTFPIDRILEICSLLEIQVLNMEEKHPFDPEVPTLAPRMALSRASMLQQISTLISLRFLASTDTFQARNTSSSGFTSNVPSFSTLLDGSSRLRCLVSKSFIEPIALQLGLQLSDYLDR